MATKNVFLWLSIRLYPNGRAFRVPEPLGGLAPYVTEDESERYTTEDGSAIYVEEDGGTVSGGILYRFHRAIALSFDRVRAGARNVLNSIHPDNPEFNIITARDWYRRLGLYDSGLVTLPDMILGILQCRSFPLVPLNKRSPAYIQGQLRAAGFDVYVYKNRFDDGTGGWITKTPGEILSVTLPVAMHGFIQHGEAQHGQIGNSNVTKIVNYLEEDKDEPFDTGSNYRSTFFIAGATITTFANVPAARRIEFRQLVLKLKGLQGVGFLFIHYT